MIFFISDLHLGYTNLIDKKLRNFKSINDMDNFIIDKINKKVKKNDLLVILGDFSFNEDKNCIKKTLYYRELINCDNIILVYGNHDWMVKNYKDELVLNNFFMECVDYLEIKNNTFSNFFKTKESFHIICNHYPLIVWNQNRHGSIQLHGHTHGNLKIDLGKSIDVGFDNIYDPISILEVLNNTKNKKIQIYDN
jgi:calcineurin-like phosphoesterase family protein